MCAEERSLGFGGYRRSIECSAMDVWAGSAKWIPLRYSRMLLDSVPYSHSFPSPLPFVVLTPPSSRASAPVFPKVQNRIIESLYNRLDHQTQKGKSYGVKIEFSTFQEKIKVFLWNVK